MYIDIGESCNSAMFNFGQGPLVTREWTIKVSRVVLERICRQGEYRFTSHKGVGDKGEYQWSKYPGSPVKVSKGTSS